MRWLLITLLAFSMVGCVPADPDDRPVSRKRETKVAKPAKTLTGDPTAELSPTDPCAERLHALCGPLLMYYKLHRKLPEKMEELAAIAGPDPDVEFACPVSGKPYAFWPEGVVRPNKPGAILISDAEPSHVGLRWAIAVEAPRNTAEPLITKVVAEPESVFQAKDANQ